MYGISLIVLTACLTLDLANFWWRKFSVWGNEKVHNNRHKFPPSVIRQPILQWKTDLINKRGVLSKEGQFSSINFTTSLHWKSGLRWVAVGERGSTVYIVETWIQHFFPKYFVREMKNVFKFLNHISLQGDLSFF